MTKKITVEQYKSAARRPAHQTETLKGLGLNKVGRRSDVPDTEATRGMIASVAHMVRVVGDNK